LAFEAALRRDFCGRRLFGMLDGRVGVAVPDRPGPAATRTQGAIAGAE